MFLNRLNGKYQFILIALSLSATIGYCADFYVSGSGKDDAAGSESEPFHTLPRAVQAVRQWRSSGGSGPATIILREGTYFLNKTLVLRIDDGAPDENTDGPSGVPGAGLSACPPYLTFTSYPGENAVISSGVPVNGWTLATHLPDKIPAVSKGKIWIADVPGQVDTFYTLYDSQGRLNRARSEGFNPAKEGTRRTLHFPPGAMRNWSNLKDVEIMVRTRRPWVLNMLPLASVDENTCTAQTAVSATYELSRLGSVPVTVWVENTLDALDEPGEWVIDSKTRKVYLWPRDKNADGSPSNILAPALTELIRVEGNIDYDGPSDTPVRGIAFRRLTFTQGDRRAWTSEQDRLGWGLQHDWEMFDRPTALLRFRGSQDCRVEECRFMDSGGTGLRLDLHARNNRIIDNEFCHLGEAGILMAGYGPGLKDVNRNNDILNNHIHHFSEIIWHAPGIWAWQSGHNRIAYNYVHHSAYSGILVTCRVKPSFSPTGEGGRTVRQQEITKESMTAMTGGDITKDWQIREKYNHARHNVVEYNRISHAVQNSLTGTVSMFPALDSAILSAIITSITWMQGRLLKLFDATMINMKH